MDTCICMAASLHCLPESITTLLIGYIPVQNKSSHTHTQRCGEKYNEIIQTWERRKDCFCDTSGA